jgi:hypothetical protein
MTMTGASLPGFSNCFIPPCARVEATIDNHII